MPQPATYGGKPPETAEERRKRRRTRRPGREGGGGPPSPPPAPSTEAAPKRGLPTLEDVGEFLARSASRLGIEPQSPEAAQEGLPPVGALWGADRPESQRHGRVGPSVPPAVAAGPEGAAPGAAPYLPTLLKTGEGGAVPYPSGPAQVRPATATDVVGQTVGGGPPPPFAPEGITSGEGAPTEGQPGRITPESIGEDWTALGFGSAEEGQQWAEAFAAEHDGNYPWEEGTMSPAANLQEHVAALKWGQEFEGTTGRKPEEGDYRIQWYKDRFGLGRNWNIPGASRGGGMGWMPREYM